MKRTQNLENINFFGGNCSFVGPVGEGGAGSGCIATLLHVPTTVSLQLVETF